MLWGLSEGGISGASMCDGGEVIEKISLDDLSEFSSMFTDLICNL